MCLSLTRPQLLFSAHTLMSSPEIGFDTTFSVLELLGGGPVKRSTLYIFLCDEILGDH